MPWGPGTFVRAGTSSYLSAAPGTATKIVCYFTDWSQCRPGIASYEPEDVAPCLCTHIICAFAGSARSKPSSGRTRSSRPASMASGLVSSGLGARAGWTSQKCLRRPQHQNAQSLSPVHSHSHASSAELSPSFSPGEAGCCPFGRAWGVFSHHIPSIVVCVPGGVIHKGFIVRTASWS